MKWHVYVGSASQPVIVDRSPFVIGRHHSCDMAVHDSSVSRTHLQLEIHGSFISIKTLSKSNTFLLDGSPFEDLKLAANRAEAAALKIGEIPLAIVPETANPAAILKQLSEQEERYCFQTDGTMYGPAVLREIEAFVHSGRLIPDSIFWIHGSDNKVLARDVEGLSFEAPPPAAGPYTGAEQRKIIDDSAPVVPGETFLCPFCRAVSSVEDVLAVSVHPEFLGDPVLGESEQQRFLPTRFTADGQAVDAGGIRCPDMACPRCHMLLPAAVLEKPLRIVSVVGAPGSGKSFFLASSIWTARHTLASRFGIGFYDLDPSINRWLNDYEERLFFQDDQESLQNIAKTDLQAVTVYRQAKIDGNPIFLPLPCLFRIAPSKDEEHVLAMYDNAGEHFQAGADLHQMPGTLHMINAEVILFLFDPSGDPRFRTFLNKGDGTASNRAQRQDILLVEMATRIKRHCGHKANGTVAKSIVFGVSKADMIFQYLPRDLSPYIETTEGAWALDTSALGEMSAALRAILIQIVPEMVDTVESVFDSVLYMPISALGHNPMREGVRPADINPFWVEVPLVYTLARLGLVSTVASR